MPMYAWEGRTRDGAVRKGTMDAPNEAVVNAQLRGQRITPTKVRKAAGAIKIKIPAFKTKVKTKDLVVFTRQFATMIDAGLPLVQCLEILSGQQSNKIFDGVLRDVKNSVELGASHVPTVNPASSASWSGAAPVRRSAPACGDAPAQ